jgi:hypothetical protein
MNINNETKILFEKGLLSTAQYEQVNEYRSRNIFSLLIELRALLYLSILLITTGIGILVYKNIDTIGHTAILSTIFLACVGCFYYCFKNSKGFSLGPVVSANMWYDYVLLAANLLAGIFMGYWQYEYEPFGQYNNIAALLPTILYFFSAYHFDNKAVLSLAITGAAAFVGLSVSPRGLLENDFALPALSYSAIAFGLALIVGALVREWSDFKSHFSFTYRNFALHIMCVTCIANLFSPGNFIYYAILVLVVAYFIWLAYTTYSVNFLFFAVLYGYIGLNIALVRLMSDSDLFTVLAYLGPFYFGASVFFFIRWLKGFRNRLGYAGVR